MRSAGTDRSTTVSAYEAEVAAERQSAAEKLVLLSQAEVRMRDAFSALSSEALRQNNRSFLELATTSLGEFQRAARLELAGRQKAIEELVQPLKESLSLVDGKLQQVDEIASARTPPSRNS